MKTIGSGLPLRRAARREDWSKPLRVVDWLAATLTWREGMKNADALLLSIALAASLACCASVSAADLVLAAGGKSDYQIILPDKTLDPAIDLALAEAADTMREMFQAGGCTLPVAKEAQADRKRPGIFLGDTAAARAAGLRASELPVWNYVWLTAGKNLIIAGRDWPAADRSRRGERSCSLGTIKGIADFMRQFGGTRFLAPGGLVGIEFLPTPKIAVPEDLNVRKAPMVNYNSGGRPVKDIASIALNLLDNVTTEYFAHTHELAVPAEAYAEKHPEYFALVDGQRIRERPHPWKQGEMVKEPHLCYSNKEVQELIYRDMLRSLDAGYPEYLSLQADGFQPCQCDECRKMFDTSDWGEKLWLLNRQWAERLAKDRPGKSLVVTAYTVTGRPPATFHDFPPNMRISLGGYARAFEAWSGCKVPAGFTSYLHAWGGYHLCGYLPTRTPLYSEKVVKMYEQYNVKGVGLDSAPAIMWGLEGPTVYVYARMLDDVKNNSALKLVDEYVQAAFGPAAGPMSRFFDELHHTLEAYAEVFGVDNGTFQHYTRTDGRSVRYLIWQTKLRLIGFLYPPETLALLESHLAHAQRSGGLSDKHRLRLALVRREFDYLASTARVVHMYYAFPIWPDKTTLGALLDELDARRKTIMAWYDTSKRPYRPGVWSQEPIARNWPMYIGGAGYYNDHLLRNGGSYLSQPVAPFTWDIDQMRKAPLLAGRTITARKTAVPLTLGSAQWNEIPGEQLGPLSLGSVAPQWATEIKVAYDGTGLYVRFAGSLPKGWDRPAATRRDRREIAECESFSVLLAPDSNPARFFRFTGGPSDAARYDARQGFIEDSLDPRFNQDDVAWNAEWRYECAVAADAGSWNALLVIPFRSISAALPASGTEWKANFARVHRIRRNTPPEISLWSSNPGTTSIDDRKSFGTLLFQ